LAIASLGTEVLKYIVFQKRAAEIHLFIIRSFHEMREMNVHLTTREMLVESIYTPSATGTRVLHRHLVT
jgi:hypothetical protein